jgi:hypothetical protein
VLPQEVLPVELALLDLVEVVGVVVFADVSRDPKTAVRNDKTDANYTKHAKFI